MLRKRESEVFLRWFWNPPIDGYTIEDCELIAKEIRTEFEKQEKGNLSSFYRFNDFRH
ncbi:hypothetical protein M2101_001083 [Parabacteroides sp. PM5-20]|uniref:hypothetical protein n=1 Tax=unclassified Parabacteroides TaxID=2649774 RepID=UPI0013D14B33|nr:MULTISPECIES: hypothetical protein [unclassified Parabacteroides]MDH6534415.1 hypothetical protein [Parabacteroides sp. PM5-20]